MNNKEIRKNKEISVNFELLEKFYPGLFKLIDNSIILSDGNISSDPVDVNNDMHEDSSISMRVFGNMFWIKLNSIGSTIYGSLYMDYDFKLSTESCMGLYKHGIEIYYSNSSKEGDDIEIYNRKNIQMTYNRNNTIQNIINE